MDKIKNLKERVAGKNKSGAGQENIVTEFIGLFRELGSVGDFLGRRYKIYDRDGELVYTIEQESLSYNQLNLLKTELSNQLLREQEESKKASKGMKKKK